MTRIENVRKKLDAVGVDAYIVYNELNQRYLSGIAFEGVLLITNNNAYLITDFRYFEMAQKSAFCGIEVSMPKNKVEYINEIFSKEKIKNVGFEGATVSFSDFSSFSEKFPNQIFTDIGTIVEELRQIKDSDEISLMQKAQDITDIAFSNLLSVITPSMTEIEVAAELEYQMRKNNADGFAFETIAVSGDASALPHGKPRNVKLKQGFLTMDFGATYMGYCSDMTRTIVIGRATDEIKHLYNTVLEAQRAGLDFIRAGVLAFDADKVARDIIESHEQYKGAFGHSLGHGVGLFVHENPRVSPMNKKTILRVGEIVTVEPGIYLQGKYGCRIEDMVAIEMEGIYNFTHSTKDLIEII